MGVGKTGVGKMGVGKMGVGKMGVGKMGISHFPFVISSTVTRKLVLLVSD